MIQKSKIKNQNSPHLPPLLAFAAHPDDLEFAIGALIAQESAAGRPCHFILCSRGESASRGTPAQRTREAKTSAKILGASLQFLQLDGDAHLQIKTAHALKIAALIRTHKPALLLAPTTVENQHPDHYRLGTLVRDAARLARYGGIRELRKLPPHAIGSLLFYANSPEAEPPALQPLLIDISEPTIIDQWTRAILAHKSQMHTRNYLELQLARARLHGLRAGVSYALPLFPADPLLLPSLSPLTRSARHF